MELLLKRNRRGRKFELFAQFALQPEERAIIKTSQERHKPIWVDPHHDRVLDDLRNELREETTTVHPDGKGYTQTIRIRNPGGGKPLSPEQQANVDAMLYIDSLPTKAARRRAFEEYETSKLLGGLSVAEYLARNPDVDSDLFTADGRYLPYCRLGFERVTLKKIGKFLRRFINPEDKEKKEDKPHLAIVQPPPEEPQEPTPPQQPDTLKEH